MQTETPSPTVKDKEQLINSEEVRKIPYIDPCIIFTDEESQSINWKEVFKNW